MTPSGSEFLTRANSEEIEMPFFHLFLYFFLTQGAVPDADLVNQTEELPLSLVCFTDEDLRCVSFTWGRRFSSKITHILTVYPIPMCAIINLCDDVLPFFKSNLPVTNASPAANA